jgi:outer membrane protein OmpA-like peptidoglycan-associated protein
VTQQAPATNQRTPVTKQQQPAVTKQQPAITKQQITPQSPGGPAAVQQKQITKQTPPPKQAPQNTPAAVNSPGGPAQQPGGPVQPRNTLTKQTPIAPEKLQQPAAIPGGQRVTNIEQLRAQRQTRTDASGHTFVQQGNRQIIQTGNRTVIYHNDTDRFARFGNTRREQRGEFTRNIITRPGGFEVINVTDRNGNLVQRIRRGPDRREVVLIDNRRRGGIGVGGAAAIAAGALATGVIVGLAMPHVTIPRDQYIVDAANAPPDQLYAALDAPPLEALDRAYTLDEIRNNYELRARMRSIDINTISFESGSWEISPDQYDRLAEIAAVMQRVLQRRPEEIFMIEGYTDAVGADQDNLVLSDYRAEAVANVLSSQFNIPPENMVPQGYGKQFLKEQTDGPSEINRRVTVRRVGPLLAGRTQ